METLIVTKDLTVDQRISEPMYDENPSLGTHSWVKRRTYKPGDVLDGYFENGHFVLWEEPLVVSAHGGTASLNMSEADAKNLVKDKVIRKASEKDIQRINTKKDYKDALLRLAECENFINEYPEEINQSILDDYTSRILEFIHAYGCMIAAQI